MITWVLDKGVCFGIGVFKNLGRWGIKMGEELGKRGFRGSRVFVEF